jgi:hypothetical protein
MRSQSRLVDLRMTTGSSWKDIRFTYSSFVPRSVPLH